MQHRSRMEAIVACKACGSENQKGFGAEIAFVFTGLRALQHAPVYTIEKPLVCLECGFTELVIPKPKLQVLKDGSTPRGNVPPE